MAETVTIPDVTRFTNNDNPVISYLSITVVVLALYILLLRRDAAKERKESNDTLSQVAAAVNVLKGVIDAKR